MTDAAVEVPAVVLRVDGSELDVERVAQLSRVRVRREASAPAACALVFEDPADARALRTALPLGAAVVVDVDGAEDALFTGSVVAIERDYAADGTLQVTARCHDAAHALRADSRLRVFVDVSVAELARELLGGTGLDVAGPDGPRLPRLVQDGRSALDLLTAVTRRAGTWWQVDQAGGRMRMFGADGDGSEATVRVGAEVLEATLTSSVVANRSGWRVLGWDPVTGGVATGAAGEVSGPDDAREAILGGALTAGADHLDALAAGLLGDDGAARDGIRAVVEGDPALVPGTTLVVDGDMAGASDRFVLLVVDHVIDTERGFLTTVSSRPPEHLRLLRRLEDVPGREAVALTVAAVLRIDDPEARGRVSVGLSAYDGLESEWLPVLALGAGQAKGLALQPDVGDTVIVAHDARDPGRGIVLGGLRTSDSGEPGVGVVEGAVGVYGLRLPTGQSIRMSASGDAVVVSNRTGSRVELTETGIVVHAEGDLVLEAPGHLLKLQADRIEMEQA